MRRSSALLAAMALFAAACGDATSTTTTTTTRAPVATAAPTTTLPPTTLPPATTTTSTTVPPTTTTTTTTTEAPTVQLGVDPDLDAIHNAFTVALDSSTSYEDSAPFIETSEGLADTVASYASTGDTFGGVSVAITDITVEGDSATVIYTLLFNENPVYSEQEGIAVRLDGEWKVAYATFCDLMRSARVGCP